MPTELGLLLELTDLDLRGLYLNGTIPTELGLLSKLEYVYLSENELTGTIPTELGQRVKAHIFVARLLVDDWNCPVRDLSTSQHRRRYVGIDNN